MKYKLSFVVPQMASLAAGLPPPKLVRQTNRLVWYYELEVNGFVVVPPAVVRAFDTNIVVDNQEICCPPGSIILIDPTKLQNNE